MFGAAAMSLSSFCVVSNALRLNLVDIFNPKHDKKRKNKVTGLEPTAAPSEDIPAEVSEEQPVETPETEESPELIEKTYKVFGMMCGHCEAHVKEALESIPEISEATASCLYDNVVIKMEAEVPEETIREAVEKAGYKLE